MAGPPLPAMVVWVSDPPVARTAGPTCPVTVRLVAFSLPSVSIAASVDATAVARAYATIKPRLEETYRKMGHPDANFDDVVALALGNLIDTPIPEQPPAITQTAQGLNFVFVDRQLESLRPAQKQLLRMGPEHQRTVQDKLREVDQAIKGLRR